MNDKNTLGSRIKEYERGSPTEGIESVKSYQIV